MKFKVVKINFYILMSASRQQSEYLIKELVYVYLKFLEINDLRTA